MGEATPASTQGRKHPPFSSPDGLYFGEGSKCKTSPWQAPSFSEPPSWLQAVVATGERSQDAEPNFQRTRAKSRAGPVNSDVQPGAKMRPPMIIAALGILLVGCGGPPPHQPNPNWREEPTLEIKAGLIAQVCLSAEVATGVLDPEPWPDQVHGFHVCETDGNNRPFSTYSKHTARFPEVSMVDIVPLRKDAGSSLRKESCPERRSNWLGPNLP